MIRSVEASVWGASIRSILAIAFRRLCARAAVEAYVNYVCPVKGAREILASDPEIANKLLAQMLPSTQGAVDKPKRPRVSQALAPAVATGKKMQDTQKPMPPAHTTMKPSLEVVQAFINWVNAGEPQN